MKNKSDRKKWLPILVVAAVVLIILAAVFGRMSGGGEAGGEDKNPAVSQEETQAAVSETAKQDEEETETADGTEADSEDESKEEETRGEFQVVERVEATYEEWLASAAVIGISMQYSEFDFKGIYLTTETKLNDHADSEGVYVLFTCEGEDVMLKCVPLEAERTEAGTIDLHAYELGFATFDEISEGDVDVSGLKEVTMDELSKTISQSLLVSLYEH